MYSFVDSAVRVGTRRVESDHLDAKSSERPAGFNLQMLGERLARLKPHLESANDFRLVASSNPRGRVPVQSLEQAMKILAPLALGYCFQTVSPMDGAGGTVKQALHQRLQVESRSTDEYW